MSHRQLTGVSLAAFFGAGAFCATLATAQAAMSPLPLHATPSVHTVDCAVGAHIGPLGGCIIGNDDRPDVVIERRSADAPDSDSGCSTKTIKRTDNMGNTETKSKTNC